MAIPGLFPILMKASAGGSAVFTEVIFTMDADPTITVDTEDINITIDSDIDILVDADVTVESD